MESGTFCLTPGCLDRVVCPEAPSGSSCARYARPGPGGAVGGNCVCASASRYRARLFFGEIGLVVLLDCLTQQQERFIPLDVVVIAVGSFGEKQLVDRAEGGVV